jgi:succinyl-CoA synthetase alpha subunit
MIWGSQDVCGPAHRHLVSMSRNSNFYEVALVGPNCPNAVAPVYKCGYSDQLECIDENGCIGVPEGIGIGAEYDWDYISKNQIDHKVFS